ncbi:hypothetical protein JYK00_05540 [Thermosipho ferrireducens]|uniref:Uncharacterized protein n=1 Tax=Thermosipho ferrireducens TaxID=2571116 RepID=A0ABX7S4A1_9BACT|nr:hypothetical protein [Thermosipho ferrireducens]QTA37212.1 hypothetical protein JYK00_05540 [Thermosipho ferrireducens]
MTFGLFVSLITGALGLLISIFFAFLIILSSNTFKYGTFRFFNEMMVLGFSILGWVYIKPKGFIFVFFLVLSVLNHLYRIVREVYSVDNRFRTLVLALGHDRFEYALFSLRRVRKRMFATFFKYSVIVFAAFSISQSLHPEEIGVISLIVGSLLIVLGID